MDETIRRTIAVIGAGPMGLTAIKTLKDEGLEPVCFERTAHHGGLWRYHEEDVDGLASVMKTTIINTSKEMSAFSDFPPLPEYPNYMHHTLMYEYIHRFAVKFDCERHIRYHHETVMVEKADDYEESGRWKVTNKNTETGEVVSEVFDGVMVCIGHHVYPNIPTFPGQDLFQGKISHTHSLKVVSEFEDQRVVVVGVGNSGMDAAVEISNVAEQVYLSSRRGVWVYTRIGPKGHPLDVCLLRRWTFLLKSLLPYSLVCWFLEMQLNKRFNHAAYNLKPKHRVLSTHPTVGDNLPIKLLSGTVVSRGAIKLFTKKGVVFEGEEKETKVDAVVLATGYKVRFPFLSEDILRVVDNRVPLYKFIFPTDLPHPTLAILGLVQPSGPGFPVGDIQARWSSRVMSGRLTLPTPEVMRDAVRVQDKANRKMFVDSPRHTFQVDFIGYQDELAEEIGAKPDLLKMIFTDFKLFWAVFTGPSLPYQYRLQGPHPWEGARQAILTYRDRAKAPFKRPGQQQGTSHKNSTILRLSMLLTILCFLWWFFYC